MKQSKSANRRKSQERFGRVMYDMIFCAKVWADENEIANEDVGLVSLACSLHFAAWNLEKAEGKADLVQEINALYERVYKLLAAEAGAKPKEKDLAAFALRYWASRL